MASISSITTPAQSFHPLSNITKTKHPFSSSSSSSQTQVKIISRTKRNKQNIKTLVSKDVDIIPVQSSDSVDQQQDGLVLGGGLVVKEAESGGGGGESVVVSGFGNVELEGGLAFQGVATSGGGGGGGSQGEEDVDKLIDRAINATIVLAAGTYAITKLLTIDHDYWHGWTLFEILKYAPMHNWIAYEEALKANPVFAKMVISGVVYSVGDWIAQCYEGKPIFGFDRARMFRSGLVGFTLHGSLSHYYYQFCEALFPFDDWWVVPAKVAFDQTVWAALWNSIYYSVVGALRLDSPVSIFSELKATFFPMLTAGWKLWPFAHLITYGVIPVEQRLLWVDCVELIWVTILSTYSNEKSEARTTEVPAEASARSVSTGPPEE